MCQFSETAKTGDLNVPKNAPTVGTNVSTSCGTEDISKIVDSKYTAIKGSATAAGCANNQADEPNAKSKYYMSQDITTAYGTANDQGWYSHTCYNYRASSDNAQYIKGIKVGNTIQFRAGWNIFISATANAVSNGQAAGIKKYEIVDDGALALAASSAVALAAVAHMGF